MFDQSSQIENENLHASTVIQMPYQDQSEVLEERRSQKILPPVNQYFRESEEEKHRLSIEALPKR